jgi:chloramphenicol-sensitive protein RarD
MSMGEHRRGTLHGIAAYAIWGLFPLYWPLLQPAGAVEILAHRIVWSLAFTVLLLYALRAAPALRALARRQVALLALAATFISVNWGIYIWAVNHGHVVETSLGYFINPLVSVMLGVAFLGERLRRGQWVAVVIAIVAVLVLTSDYGRVPWIALALAGTFGLYGFVKKKAGVPALAALTIETALLFLPALGYLAFLESRHAGTFGHAGALNTVLLAAAGVVTAIPLLSFASAANRVPLSLLGILQYIAPTLQFLCGVVVFHEPMTTSRWVGFALVWTSLAAFSLESLLRLVRPARLVGGRAEPGAETRAIMAPWSASPMTSSSAWSHASSPGRSSTR